MIFVINSGSSSLKFKVFDAKLKTLASGIVERIGLDKPFIKISEPDEAEVQLKTVPHHTAALGHVIDALDERGIDVKKVTAFGHRVVHGGEEFVHPTVVTPAVIKGLKKYSKIAPLHNPANVAGIESCRSLAPKAANVAVFDTGFYSTVPAEAFMYALPWEMYSKHKIRKYGFHGISHDYVSGEAARKLGKPLSKLKLVTCHLGSGSSVTAVKNGKAFDTTMGFTPLEGLTMSTRCGDIDPAIPLYLIRELKKTPAQVDDIMNKQSGLLGVSGYKDLRDVMVAAGHDVGGHKLVKKPSAEQAQRSKLAVDMYCYDVARYIGQFAAVMGGADAIVFTAGVGERSEVIRRKIMGMIALPGKPKVMVVPTNEELMIAKGTLNALKKA